MRYILSIESSCDDSCYYKLRKMNKLHFTTLTLSSTKRRAHAQMNRANGAII